MDLSDRVTFRGVTTFPERLQWVIDHRGLRGAKHLSELSSLAPGHVASLIRGDVKTGNMDTVAAIAKAGRVSYRWLATGEGSPDDESTPDPSDPFPLLSASLAPFRSSEDPIVQRVVAEFASSSFNHAERVDAERWTRRIIARIDEARADAADPSLIEARRVKNEKLLDEHEAFRQRSPMPKKK